MCNHMKNNNKGFSLIEVIVVAAILVVLAGTATIGYNMLSGRAASQCASQLKSIILLNRTHALGMTSADVSISVNSNGVFVTETINGGAGSSKNIGKSDVNVSYSLDGGASYNDLSGTSVSFSFDRSSGALASINGVAASTDIKFKVSKNSSNYIVTVHHLTGKTDIE